MDIVELIQELGFPVVAFFLMWRMANTAIRDNTKAIDRLTTMIGKNDVEKD